MHLTSDTPAAHPPAGIDAVAGRLQAAVAQLTAIAQQAAQVERDRRDGLAAAHQAGIRLDERFAAEDAATADPVPDLPQHLTRLHGGHAAWLARIGEAATRRRRLLRADADRRQKAVAGAGPTDARDTEQLRATTRELRQALERALEDVAALRLTAGQWEAQLLTWGRRARIEIGGARSAFSALAEGPLDQRLAALRAEIDGIGASVTRAGRSSAYGDSHLGGILGNHVLAVLPFGLGAGFLIWGMPLPAALPWVAGTALAAQFLVPLLTRRQRRRCAEQFSGIRQAIGTFLQRLAQYEHAARQQFDPEGPLQRHLERFGREEALREADAEASRQRTERALTEVRDRERRIRARLDARRERLEEDVRRDLSTAGERQRQERAAHRAGERRALAERVAAVGNRHGEERTRFLAQWSQQLTELGAWTAAALAAASGRQPAWDQPSWDSWTPPTRFPDDVLVGRAHLPAAALATAIDAGDLPLPTTDLAVPVSLAFPSPSSLLIRAGPDGRERALRLMERVLLRALTAFPAGRLRLTLIDPIGLGESFAPFLDLADREGALIGDGVLNEAGRIEQGLADLIAHVEVVIQKRLRGRYATIEDYNREAGEMQEPLHLVAVADFPAGFGERALERLATLARSGARCGVHLLIVHDDRRPVPAALDLAWFRRTGIVLRDVGGRLAIDHEALHEWAFDAGPAPESALRKRLLGDIARAASRATRIEVPFAAVAPDADAMWSLSSAAGLRVPIGKCGADRLQYLELGRGTSQHVLVGGRTGSGKSTLFHVLISAASLWYHPRELEFHLIDFKKGVEFRSYAAHRLPHARIIAIESDREFGLSVLRHLDQELTRRGELFRRVGAQDLAAHRAAGGEHLARQVLLIDEFQEFFTEDDTIARDAALLLDRFVRQGRAFGLHVVLGSQTLGGAYSLAKSSLGQMGVRIVLPCNEADAHLLLNEDNDGARLLNRPGDGIYNDRAGMAEGNSPFQACWLSDEQEVTHLRRIAERALAADWRAARPTVVFEGDVPARLADIEELLRVPSGAVSAAPLAGWIGQSSSLKGPAELVLPDAAGGNLLIVGQNREAAAATCGALMISFALRHPGGGVRLPVLDGEDADGPFAALHARLGGLLPAGAERHPARDAATLLAGLEADLERRRAGDPERVPIVLTVFAAQRLRQLRPDEDLAYGADAAAQPAERFARLLADGPEYGIHVITWCDSLASVQRGLGRRALRSFDLRILFQMSAGDSGELIDAADASRLSLHTAILASQNDGRCEKFRPFSLPDPACIARLEALTTRRGP